MSRGELVHFSVPWRDRASTARRLLATAAHTGMPVSSSAEGFWTTQWLWDQAMHTGDPGDAEPQQIAHELPDGEQTTLDDHPRRRGRPPRQPKVDEP